MACTKDVVDNEPVSFQDVPQTRAGGDGKYDILGYGYDATGKYAHPAYVKLPVVDIQAIKNSADSGRLHIDYMPYGDGEFFFGETSVDYVKALTRSISTSATTKDTVKLFTGSLKSSFSDRREEYERNSFASSSIYAAYTRVIANMSPEFASSYLSRPFWDDLQTQSPDYIISRYGTHVMLGIDLGAKLNIIYSSTTTRSDKQTTVSHGMQLGILKVFNKNIEVSTSTSLATQNHDQWIAYEIVGGNPIISPFRVISLDQTPPQLDLGPWENSVNGKENAALVGFVADHLIPIYEFVPNATKKAQIKAAYDRYIASKQIVIIKEPDPVPVYNKILMYSNKPKSYPSATIMTLSSGDVNQDISTKPTTKSNWIVDCSFKLLEEFIPNETVRLIYTKKQFRGPNMFDRFTLYDYSSTTGSNASALGCMFKTQKEGTIPLYKYTWSYFSLIGGNNKPWYDFTFITTQKGKYPSMKSAGYLTSPRESIIGYVYPPN